MVVLILASKRVEAEANLIFSLANLAIDFVLTKCLFIKIENVIKIYIPKMPEMNDFKI